MITLAALSAIGFLLLLIKAIGLKRVIQYEVPIDIGITLGFLMFSGGTYSGIVLSVYTGLIMSLLLTTLKICTK